MDYRPDVIVHAGDHFDFASLSGHEEPGSAPLEGQRYKDDLDVGNAAFARICKPMEDEIARLKANKKKGWEPRKLVTKGNHEIRADRVANNNPKLLGTVGSHQCDFRDWEVFEFLQVAEADGVLYSHFFANPHSGRPIGGTATNRLTRIGASYCHGHVQGLDMGTKILGNGKTIWGIQNGACYVHIEHYRGEYSPAQRHFRGIVILNEVDNGEHCPMPLSLDYLCRKYEGMSLHRYMVLKYPHQHWQHLI